MKVLDKLFAAYLKDGNVESLLESVRRRAMYAFRDEDAAQNFTIGVWRMLPNLKAEGSFSAFIGRRLRWRSKDNFKRKKRENRKVQQPPLLFDEDGESLTDEESLDILRFRSLSKGPRTDDEFDVEEIDDPLLRQIAVLLLAGFTQQEIAFKLGKSLGSIKQKLLRSRHKTEEMRLAA